MHRILKEKGYTLKFEVKDRDGRTVMSTKYKVLYLSRKNPQPDEAAGFRLYLNGKLLKKGFEQVNAINIGLGNFVSADRVVAIVSP